MVLQVMTEVMLDDEFGGGGRKPPASLAERVARLAKQRLRRFPPPKPLDVALFPVAIMFANQARSEGLQDSIDLWHRDSGRYFDLLFPGWYRYSGALKFSADRFVTFKDEVQQRSSYVYSGDTDLLILNFEYLPKYQKGQFVFDQVIDIRVDELIAKQGIVSLNALVTELVNAAKGVYSHTGSAGVWEISDKIGMVKVKQGLFDALIAKADEYLGGTLGKTAPFAVRNYQAG